MVKATDIVEAMISNYVQVLNQDIQVDKVILYGSRAKGEELKNSDVDLVVISEDFKEINFLKRLEMLELKWPYATPLEALGYTKNEFESLARNIGIVAEVKKHGVEVFTL